MSDFLRCDRCEGFIPSAAVVCPNCQTRTSGRLARVLIGGAALVTLAACYGPPANKVRPDPQPDPNPPADQSTSH
jgi:hypothetical protein